ncbi:ion channel [Gymnopilus junonius]|uniref:Ion channel n=1 Tax=Gymnopilus junonius TaxID=109634 RepID=A0A9P5TSN8_GYMJU|nr:ion channel [Gymnopilus junonius]
MENEGYWVSDDTRAALLNTESKVKNKIRSVWGGFVNFALRDNVLEVAVGLIIAAAFTSVVKSLVSDILLPPISLLPFMSRNLEEKFVILKKGPHFRGPNQVGYNTRKQALDDGAVILTYGAFFDELVNFIGLGLVLYLVANIYGYFSKDSIIKNTTKCTYCRKEIGSKAKRCPMCTSWLDGREDKETSVLTSPPPGQA